MIVNLFETIRNNRNLDFMSLVCVYVFVFMYATLDRVLMICDDDEEFNIGNQHHLL